jgi:Fe-S-cluster containining protein
MEKRQELINDLGIMRFQCTRCGKCCSDPKTFVNLTYLDILRIKKGLKADIQELLKYVGFYTFENQNMQELMEHMVYSPVETEKGLAFIGILRKDNGRCIFLNEDNTCSIYEWRPRICQTFPFTFNITNLGDINTINDPSTSKDKSESEAEKSIPQIEGLKQQLEANNPQNNPQNNAKKSLDYDLIYAKKGIEFCPGISIKSPVVKKKKILALIGESLAEISSDYRMLESWNNLAKLKKILPKATNYILAILKLDEKVKEMNKDEQNKSVLPSQKGKNTNIGRKKSYKFQK